MVAIERSHDAVCSEGRNQWSVRYSLIHGQSVPTATNAHDLPDCSSTGKGCARQSRLAGIEDSRPCERPRHGVVDAHSRVIISRPCAVALVRVYKRASECVSTLACCRRASSTPTSCLRSGSRNVRGHGGARFPERSRPQKSKGRQGTNEPPPCRAENPLIWRPSLAPPFYGLRAGHGGSVSTQL